MVSVTLSLDTCELAANCFEINQISFHTNPSSMLCWFVESRRLYCHMGQETQVKWNLLLFWVFCILSFRPLCQMMPFPAIVKCFVSVIREEISWKCRARPLKVNLRLSNSHNCSYNSMLAHVGWFQTRCMYYKIISGGEMCDWYEWSRYPTKKCETSVCVQRGNISDYSPRQDNYRSILFSATMKLNKTMVASGTARSRRIWHPLEPDNICRWASVNSAGWRFFASNHKICAGQVIHGKGCVGKFGCQMKRHPWITWSPHCSESYFCFK